MRRVARHSRAMRVIGLMSGTSADGIDAAIVRISGAPPHFDSRLERFASLPYPPRIRAAILRLANGGETTTGELSQLNFLLGELFAAAAQEICRRARIAMRSVDLVGSHGQTMFHQGRPAAFLGARIASTLQLGEPAVIAERTGVPVVADFRPADIAAGGQGAPLVGYVDYLLYRDPGRRGARRDARVALNIGGIANVSVIPRGAAPSEVLAFDTGPGNMVVDALAHEFTKGRQNYDRDARIALQGRMHSAILDSLLTHPFFREAPPKTAGREQFGPFFVERVRALGHKFHATPEDLVRTATLLTPVTIAQALGKYVRPRHPVREVIVSGGGASNPLMMSQLAALLPNVQIRFSDDYGVPTAAKEAFAFAILAYECWHGRPNSLPAATGARHASILGKIVHAPRR